MNTPVQRAQLVDAQRPDNAEPDPTYQLVPVLTWQQASKFLGWTDRDRMIFEPGTFQKKP